MSNELTEAERAAADVLLYEEGSEWAEGTERHEELARKIVAAVAPIIKRETLDRFGDRMGTFNPPLLRTLDRDNGPLNSPSIFNDNP